MRAYKASYNQKCRDFLFEIGKTYEIEGELKMCNNGFHFCETILNTLEYYTPDHKLVIFEVEALGDIQKDGNKFCTNKIKIIRIVPREEYEDIVKFDENGNLIYRKCGDGCWKKYEYDSNGNKIRCENSNGYWWTREYDENGNKIRYDNSFGWRKWEYDYDGNLIRYEDSAGYWKIYEYDSNGNKIRCEASDGYWWTCEYDSNSNLQ